MNQTQGRSQPQLVRPMPPQHPWNANAQWNANANARDLRSWLYGTMGHKVVECPQKRPPVSRCAIVLPEHKVSDCSDEPTTWPVAVN